MEDADRTASLMTPAKLAQARPKAPVSPAAWLDRMATDAGHQHVRRLGELRVDLQAQAGKRDFAPLAAALARVAETLPKLDFGLLQQKKPGLLARMAGKNKNAVGEFASQYDQIDAAANAVAEQAKSLQGRQGEQASRTDLSLLEFEVEYRAIEKIIDQGARWLQDMRNQLKAREAAGADEAGMRQIREDAQRCELLVARLKALRTLSTAAQQLHLQAQEAAARRASVVQAMQTTVARHVKDWRSRIAPLADAARDGESAPLSLEGPMDCHRDLQLCIKQAGADCGQVQVRETTLAEGLDALAAPLAACATS